MVTSIDYSSTTTNLFRTKRTELPHITFAILSVLAERPDGCATLQELDSELEANGERDEFSDLHDIDVLQLGLAVLQDDRVRITEAGRSVLRGLQDLAHATSPTEQVPQSLKLIDDLIGAEHRRKIFDLGLRSADERPFVDQLEEMEKAEDLPVQADTVRTIEEPEAAAEPVATTGVETYEDNGGDDRVLAARPSAPSSPITEAPSFLNRSFSQRETRVTSDRTLVRKSFAVVATHARRFLQIWRGHIQSETPGARSHRVPARGISGFAAVLLTIMALVLGVGTLIAVNQIRSLKTEIAALERELAPLKKQAARLATIERQAEANRSSALPNIQDTRGTDRGNAASQNQPAPAALLLSPDEIRIVRDYIKPAPSPGAGIAAVNVGDPISGGTIPLPSPLTDKVPKLQGARFTIRNGTIIILKRDSLKADAVLPPL